MNPQTPNYTPARQSRLPLVIVSILLVIALVFGGWAYIKMQDYKDNSDKRSAVAVAAADKQLTAQLQAQFAQQAKQPYKNYQGSATYGTISFNYPKTWSAYDAGNSDEPINAYFFPDIVPSTDSNVAFPLRIELTSTDYSDAVAQFGGQTEAGTVKASAYVPPKMKGVASVTPGTRFDGAIGDNGQQGSMVIIKVRDKTLQISTQTTTALDDFNNVVLASLTFVP